MPERPDESRPAPPLTPEGQAALQDLLDPARLLHARCGRPVAEHPYGSIHLPCPYPPRPPVEFRRVEPDPPKPLDPDEVVLEQARAILRRHGHGISATCTDACHPPAPAGVPPCPRCSSPRWVSVSLDGGYTRRAQCVPCGHVQPQPIGPGWKAGG